VPPMATPLRIEFAGAVYHVTSRGERREAIYEGDEDRETFLSTLEEVVERFNSLFHPYCLMTKDTTWRTNPVSTSDRETAS